MFYRIVGGPAGRLTRILVKNEAPASLLGISDTGVRNWKYAFQLAYPHTFENP